MKKLLVVLLTLCMIFSMAACGGKADAPAADETKGAADAQPTQNKGAEDAAGGEVEVVTYYCSIGAYLDILQREIAAWNEGAGKEQGVNIELISDINEYSNNLKAMLGAGNYYDIVDFGTGNRPFIEQGLAKDLRSLDDPDLQALVASYEDMLQPGVNIVNDTLYALPLEVLPIKFVCNTDLFEKNNLELPETWDDVLNAAKVITENGDGVEFGFGWTNWSAAFRRLAMKATANSTGRLWWDPNTASYDFSIYETVIKDLATMYQEGWMTGADDLAIDPIRAQFAEGTVGMFVAPAYDVAVYTSQFPAKCNWTVIDTPLFKAGQEAYKGVYLNRVNCSIVAPAYDGSSEVHQKAVQKAWTFLNSDELYATIYANAGMIPAKASIMEGVTMEVDIPQWEQMSDTSNYAPMPLYPDSLMQIEGESFADVFSAIMHGDLEWSDEVIQDLNDRYNAAYQELKASGDVSLEEYEQPFSLKK